MEPTLKTKEQFIQEFQENALARQDFKRLNAYMWLETIQHSLTKSEVMDKLINIHYDEKVR